MIEVADALKSTPMPCASTDDSFDGAASMILLTHCRALAEDAAVRLGSCDNVLRLKRCIGDSPWLSLISR